MFNNFSIIFINILSSSNNFNHKVMVFFLTFIKKINTAIQNIAIITKFISSTPQRINGNDSCYQP